MKVLHVADLHYGQKQWAFVHAGLMTAIEHAKRAGCDLIVLAGDSFDHGIQTHEPAFSAFVEAIIEAASSAPVLILQGTFSHDRPGALSALRSIGTLTDFPIHVADQGPERIALCSTMTGSRFELNIPTVETPFDAAAILCCVPSLNVADRDIMSIGPEKWFGNVITRWSPGNESAREAGVPTMLITHGTVQGARAETSNAIIAPDHVFSADMLAMANCDAVMLGHIHKHQFFERSGTNMVYPGSLVHLVHGHTDQAGYVMWDFLNDDVGVWAEFTFFPVVGRNFVSIDFPGVPDMEDLSELAAEAKDEDHIRIRYTIDQEHAHSVDPVAIRKMFAHVADLKIEGTINAVQSVRAPGMATSQSLGARLSCWAETTGDDDNLKTMIQNLELLKSMDLDMVVGYVQNRIDQGDVIANVQSETDQEGF